MSAPHVTRHARRTLAATLFVLAAGGLLAGPAAALGTAQASSPAGYGMTSGRLAPTAVAVLSLIATVVGGLALARRPAAGRGSGTGRRGAVVALALGLVGVVVGGVLAATADGGLGTGNGLAGSVIGVVLGLVAVGLGAAGLRRSRQLV